MIKRFALTTVTIIMCFVAAAQRLSLAVNYNPAVPMGSSFKEYVSKTSFRGFQGLFYIS